ncbi:hypothetical protein [Capnocytophaga catalasegens]|uniref:Lipoprotein n=1 Tax=Capnocytophaga catalasegens TaxID=1004260 RepID=A0AAV5AUT3_9FLAO|nr:hypothetical protein [Capnocytophaga catalasegens]GIZ15438.1 hypothetical protein RCZ03_14380 [Capnocytophaga catalasegens]GJM51026.1 hypothetical protein RCZ15_19990 [Capnocytophaga catalasegens]GJM52211.1 hypothetical protein RCZ16_05290 [Capnocytophaga catalasegens]
MLCTGFLLTSCSENLTTSKAEDIVEEYLKEKPKNGQVAVYAGKINADSYYLMGGNLEKYKKLAADRYLNMEYKEEERGRWSIDKYYIISLTNKSQDFVLKIIPDDEKTRYEMRTYTIELDEISDIFIRKEEKTATSKAKFKKKDKTPFFIFEDDPTDFSVQDVLFYKTEDKGWRLMNEKGRTY